ncbi:DUF86 domain-containing protein [Candidatus Poribacteria bacterium]|nr:DUF86 domain-containing protein [Candidatus Poribacteria bacterium]
MSPNYGLYLQNAVAAIDRIASYVEGVDRGKFETEQMSLDAVIRNLQIIGEVVKKIPNSIQKRYSNIP